MVVQPRTIAGIVPGLQAVSLLAYNMPDKDAFKMKSSKKMAMKKPVRRMVRKGVGNLVGIGLIRPTAQMVNTIPTI